MSLKFLFHESSRQLHWPHKLLNVYLNFVITKQLDNFPSPVTTSVPPINQVTYFPWSANNCYNISLQARIRNLILPIPLRKARPYHDLPTLTWCLLTGSWADFIESSPSLLCQRKKYRKESVRGKENQCWQSQMDFLLFSGLLASAWQYNLW